MLFRKKARQEIEHETRQKEQAAREVEAARLDLQLSRRKLANLLGVPVDEALAAIGEDLAGKPRE